MTKPTTTPLNAETAYAIAGVCLLCTGHWIGGALLLVLAYHTSASDRNARELANLPSDEIGVQSDLPSIVAPAPIAPQDAWKPDSNT